MVGIDLLGNIEVRGIEKWTLCDVSEVLCLQRCD